MSATRYPRSQIALHWLIALMVVVQWIFGDDMARAFETMMQGGAVDDETPAPAIAAAHGFVGTLIGLLMLVRLYLRLTNEIPPPPPQASRTVQIVSRANHWAFYLLLIAMPIVGHLAWWGESWTLARIHAWSGWTLLALAILHVCGAGYHAFVLRDRTVHRMAPRESR